MRRRSWQFSFGTLLLLMLIAALAIRFLATRETGTFVVRSQCYWIQNARALVHKDERDGEWQRGPIVPAHCSVCYIHEHVSARHSTAGGSKELIIQLPFKLEVGTSLELRSLSSDKTGYQEMYPGEIYASRWAHPSTFGKLAVDSGVVGTMTVVAIDSKGMDLAIDAQLPITRDRGTKTEFKKTIRLSRINLPEQYGTLPVRTYSK